jgi:hypothetical protein
VEKYWRRRELSTRFADFQRKLVEAAGVVPRATVAGRRSKPNFDAGTKAERSEGLVEAAGVEPASENTSPQNPTCVSPFD